MVFDMVVPDYYAKMPKPCMGGWGRGIMNVTPQGRVLPCHAAEIDPGSRVRQRRDKPLADIWLNGQAFQKYRGTELDEGALPQPARARNRLRRLPLPGDGLHGRCGEHRPGLQLLAPSCGICRSR